VMRLVVFAREDAHGMGKVPVGQEAGINREEAAAAHQQHHQGDAPHEIGEGDKNRLNGVQIDDGHGGEAGGDSL
jgi:hypothetical protein